MLSCVTCHLWNIVIKLENVKGLCSSYCTLTDEVSVSSCSCEHYKCSVYPSYQGCARFPEFLLNFSEHQILWSLCLVDFLALTLKLSILTLLSVAPELQVSLSLHEKCPNFRKTSTPLLPQYTQNTQIPFKNSLLENNILDDSWY